MHDGQNVIQFFILNFELNEDGKTVILFQLIQRITLKETAQKMIKTFVCIAQDGSVVLEEFL